MEKISLVRRQQTEAMSAFWTMMSGSKYEPAIESVNAARRELKLDDWGYVALWRDAVQALQPERKADKTCCSGIPRQVWLRCASGYAGTTCIFLLRSNSRCSRPSSPGLARRLTTRCWPLTAATASLFYTYEASYPVKLKPLDIGLLRPASPGP